MNSSRNVCWWCGHSFHGPERTCAATALFTKKPCTCPGYDDQWGVKREESEVEVG